MPNKDAHISAARENQNTIDYLMVRRDEHSGWIATIAFYKALHIVETLFSSDPKGNTRHTDEHKSRNNLLKREPRYQHIWHHYRVLFEASLIARYLREGHEVFASYMPPSKVESVLLKHHLAQVEKSACKLLNEEIDFNSEKQNLDGMGEAE